MLYGITDLGALPNGKSEGLGISPDGIVVGVSIDKTSGLEQAVVFDTAGGLPTPVAPAAKASRALAMNDLHQVVGYYDDGTPHAFLWQAGVRTDLPNLGTGSKANDINHDGQIVGSYYPTADHTRSEAYVYNHATGQLTPLGRLGGWSSEATAVNRNGHVVGWSDTPTQGEQHAFFWSPQTGLVNLHAQATAGAWSVAHDINVHDVVVGGSSVSAFAWSATTGMHKLHGGDVANAINDSGVIVGDLQSNGFSTGMVWRTSSAQGQILMGLLPPGTTVGIWSATDIDNRGDVAGIGFPEGGFSERAILLDPETVGINVVAPSPDWITSYAGRLFHYVPNYGPGLRRMRHLDPTIAEAVLGLSIVEMASAMENVAARQTIQRTALAVVSERVQQVRNVTDEET